MTKFYVTEKENLSGDGKHIELRLNLGYVDGVISFDKALITEILDLTLKGLATEEEEKQK